MIEHLCFDKLHDCENILLGAVPSKNVEMVMVGVLVRALGRSGKWKSQHPQFHGEHIFVLAHRGVREETS